MQTLSRASCQMPTWSLPQLLGSDILSEVQTLMKTFLPALSAVLTTNLQDRSCPVYGLVASSRDADFAAMFSQGHSQTWL